MPGCFDFLMSPGHAAARTNCKMITQDNNNMQEEPRQHEVAPVAPVVDAWSPPAIVLQLRVATVDTASIGHAFARALDAQIAALEPKRGGHELQGIEKHRQCPWPEFDAKVQIVTTDELRALPVIGASGATVEGHSVQEPLGGHSCKKELHEQSCRTKRVKWLCTEDLDEKKHGEAIDELGRKLEQCPDSTRAFECHGSTIDGDNGLVDQQLGDWLRAGYVAQRTGAAGICYKKKTKHLVGVEQGATISSTSIADVAMVEPKQAADEDLHSNEEHRLFACSSPIHTQHHEPPLAGRQHLSSTSSTPSNVSFMDNDEQQVENPAACGTVKGPEEPMCKMQGSTQLAGNGTQPCFPLDSGLWSVVLSMAFCFGGKCSPYATSFNEALQQDLFFGNFRTYIPSRKCRASCDPRLTTLDHPCRGTLGSCRFPQQLNHDREGKPTIMSCWRVILRYHQEQCKVSNGFMIQVQEQSGLSDIQKIEAAMAEEAKLKIFRTCTDLLDFDSRVLSTLVVRVRAWFDAGCVNFDTENISVGSNN